MISRKSRAVSSLKSVAAALVLFLPIMGMAQMHNLSSQNTQTTKPQVVIFSDGGDDRAFGHTTTDAGGNLYIAADLGDPNLTNAFGVLKYSPQGKLLGAFHFSPKQLSGGFALDVKVDAAGNIYACGFSFPFGGIVISFDPSGNTRWTQFIGSDQFFSMQLDQSGHIYVGGDSAGAILVAKLTTDGKVLWKRQHQGATITNVGAAVTDLQLDSKGNIVVIGDTGNAEFHQDTTVLKLDPEGDILWTQDFGQGPGFNSIPRGGAVDHNDGIYATGTALNVFTGEQVPYTIKYDTDGNRQFLLTGAGNGGTAIALDPAGDIVLDGATLIKDETVATVSKIDPSGATIFVTPIQTTGALNADSQGNIYVSGANFFTSGNIGFQVIKLNSDGTVLFTFDRPLQNFLSLQELPISTIDPFGNLLVTGSFLPKGSGVSDIVVLKLPNGFKPVSSN